MSVMTKTTEPEDFLSSSLAFDAGIDEGFFGQHMSATELDAEFLSRLPPSHFIGLSDFQQTAWWGYRFLHPAYRVFLFIHFYQKAYRKCAKMIGRRFIAPSFCKANPLADATKSQITGLVKATFTADAHGIPYDFWCDTMMDYALRGTIRSPPQPVQMYVTSGVKYVLDKWAERNEAGIYLAKAPEFRMENYVGHPVQDAYQNYLLDNVATKGNKAFWLSRLIYTVEQVTIENATKRFGAEVVEDAKRFI